MIESYLYFLEVMSRARQSICDVKIKRVNRPSSDNSGNGRFVV